MTSRVNSILMAAALFAAIVRGAEVPQSHSLATASTAPSGVRADRDEVIRRMDEQLKEIRRKIATEPPKTAQDAFEQQVALSVFELGAAMVKEDAAAAAKFYFATGDGDGSYAFARQKRTIAVHRLVEVVSRKIGPGGEELANELRLIDLADDMYGLLMVEWTSKGDRASGEPPPGAGGDDERWVPSLEKIDGRWKIDVTDETGGDAKGAALRAQEETKKLEQIITDITNGKLQKLDDVRSALSKANVKGPGKPV